MVTVLGLFTIIMSFILVVAKVPLYASRVAAAGVLAHDEELFRAPNTFAHPSCIDPSPEERRLCDIMAQRILASTVRVTFQGIGPISIGHGTIIGGRYVITHNHYPNFPPEQGGDEASGATRISIAMANGKFVVYNATSSSFTVIAAEPGILLLDFRTIGEVGFFDYYGLPSAPFKAWDSRSLHAAREVAQVNWDGDKTFVQWVRTASDRDTGRNPAFELENFIELGASGGGVFSDGYHIGNNWLQGKLYYTGTHALARVYSVAAANSASAFQSLIRNSPVD